MTKQAIVEKVKKYLEKRFLIINENAISYSGIREDSPIFNSNERKAMHIVNYAIESV
jgi:acid phosphatase class B